MIVIVPTDPPNLPSVDYSVTTTYHWAQFDKNITYEFGNNPVDGFKEVYGPYMFEKGIGLSGDKQVN